MKVPCIFHQRSQQLQVQATRDRPNVALYYTDGTLQQPTLAPHKTVSAQKLQQLHMIAAAALPRPHERHIM